MEPSKEFYQRTFSRLKASPELGKELLSMTEKTRKPKKFILRRLAVAAAVTALAAALAMGANAATGGELYEATIGKLVYTFKMDDGNIARMYEGKSADGKVNFIIEEEGAASSTDESGLVCGRSYEVETERTYEVETDENGSASYKAYETVTGEDGGKTTREIPGEASDVSSVPQE